MYLINCEIDKLLKLLKNLIANLRFSNIIICKYTCTCIFPVNVHITIKTPTCKNTYKFTQYSRWPCRLGHMQCTGNYIRIRYVHWGCCQCYS